MRFLVTIVLALLASWLAGSLVATGVAIWANGDESFILAFMAVPAFSLICLVAMLIAATRAEPARALNRVAIWIVFLLALALGIIVLVVMAVEGSVPSAWRGIQVMLGITGGCAAVVIGQWLVFLWRNRPVAPPMPRFGRGAAS